MKRLILKILFIFLLLLFAIIGTLLWQSRDIIGFVNSLENDAFVRLINNPDRDLPEKELTLRKPRNWVELKNISKLAYGAIVVSEDWSFFQHDGLDTDQIKKALRDKIIRGERLRGASTITQQVAKNLFFNNQRSFERKVKEAVVAKLLENKLSKKKILEIYLNIIQFGDGIYGIYEASKYYFGVHPSRLGPRQGAFLAMLLPNPKMYAYSFENKKLSDYARQTIDSILFKMKVAGMMSAQEWEASRDEKFAWEKEYRAEDMEPKILDEDESFYDLQGR